MNTTTRPTPPAPLPEGKGAGGVGLLALALLTLAATAGIVLAVPDAPEIAPAPRLAKAKFVAPKFNDSFDVLVFTNLRPVRVRVTTLQDGKPIGERWRDRLQKAFAFCDRDGDGFLNTKEVAFAFSDQGMVQLLQSGLYQPTPTGAPTLEKLDQDGDGKVSFEEFVSYYKLATAYVIRALPVQPDNYTNAAVTESLFKLLDANGDGKLTKDEVKAAEKLLVTRDADEDECLSMAELAPELFGRNLGVRQRVVLNQPANGAPYPVQASAQTVIIYDAGRIPGTVTQQVIKKYDKDGDFELTRAEVGFDDLTFKALDTDGNGKLDGEELDAWRTGPADLDVTLSLAPREANCTAKLADEKAAAARGLKLRRSDGGRLTLQVGRQTIDFWAFIQPQNDQPLKRGYSFMFTQAANGKKFVEEKDLNGPNAVQFQLLRVLFESADRDADGKLTQDEFDAYFDLQDSFRNIGLSLIPEVQTPTLFQLLDDNSDGRLSVRELRTAWPRLLALEEPGVEVITKGIIQPTVTVRLTRTSARYNAQVQFAQSLYANQNQVPVPTKGPVWFRKMDRNGDGDVSRAEFIGTKDEFDAIDTDRDDLISLEEAEAFDRKMREKP